MAITLESTPAMVAPAGNRMPYVFSTSVSSEFIGIHCKLYVDKGSGSYELVGGEKRLPPDSDSEVTYDPMDLLQWEPPRVFSFPETPSAILVKCNDLRRRYYIRRSEKYGIPLAEYSAANTTAKYIIPGGISKISKALINEAATDWFTKLSANKSFLSVSNPEKVTDPFAYERLFFLVYSNITGLRMKIVITYTDGTTSAIITFATATCAQYDIFELVCSFAALGLAYYNTAKKVKKYSIYLSDSSNNIISETRTFILDTEYRPNSRYFIFNNAYKMPEGIRFAGSGFVDASYLFDSIQKILQADQQTTDQEEEVIFSQENRSLTVTTGWISENAMVLYRQFILSKRIFWIVNGMTIPMIVDAKKVIIKKDDEHLYSMTLALRMASPDEYAADELREVESASDYVSGSELLTSWENMVEQAFGTFTLDGTDIDSALEAVGGGGDMLSLIILAESFLA